MAPGARGIGPSGHLLLEVFRSRRREVISVTDVVLTRPVYDQVS